MSAGPDRTIATTLAVLKVRHYWLTHLHEILDQYGFQTQFETRTLGEERFDVTCIHLAKDYNDALRNVTECGKRLQEAGYETGKWKITAEAP